MVTTLSLCLVTSAKAVEPPSLELSVKQERGNEVQFEWTLKNPPTKTAIFSLYRQPVAADKILIFRVEAPAQGKALHTGVLPDGKADYWVEAQWDGGGPIAAPKKQLETFKAPVATFFEPFDKDGAPIAGNFDPENNAQDWKVKDGVLSQTSEAAGKTRRLLLKTLKNSDGEIRAKIRIDGWGARAAGQTLAADLNGVGIAIETIAGQSAAYTLQFHQPKADTAVHLALIDIVEDGRVDAGGTALKNPQPPIRKIKLPKDLFVRTPDSVPNTVHPWVWLSLKRVNGELIGKLWLDGEVEPSDANPTQGNETADRSVVLRATGQNRSGTQPLGPPALLGGQGFVEVSSRASFDEVTFRANSTPMAAIDLDFKGLEGNLDSGSIAFQSRTSFSSLPVVEQLVPGRVAIAPEGSLEAEAEADWAKRNNVFQIFISEAKRAEKARIEKATKSSLDNKTSENEVLDPPPATTYQFCEFEKLAQFPYIEFGDCTDAILREGVKIHEGMRVIVASDGRYEVVFTATAVALPVTMNLQLQSVKNKEVEWTLTLPPVDLFEPQSISKGVRSTWIVRIPGYSERFNTLNSGPNFFVGQASSRASSLGKETEPAVKDSTILRRTGSARFGASAEQLARIPVGSPIDFQR